MRVRTWFPGNVIRTFEADIISSALRQIPWQLRSLPFMGVGTLKGLFKSRIFASTSLGPATDPQSRSQDYQGHVWSTNALGYTYYTWPWDFMLHPLWPLWCWKSLDLNSSCAPAPVGLLVSSLATGKGAASATQRVQLGLPKELGKNHGKPAHLVILEKWFVTICNKSRQFEVVLLTSSSSRNSATYILNCRLWTAVPKVVRIGIQSKTIRLVLKAHSKAVTYNLT